MLTPEHVDEAVRLSLATLRPAASADWDVPAGTLSWSCWETAEHLADDLFAYAAQLGAPTADREVPFSWVARRAGGPANVTFADRDAGVPGLLDVVRACGALLVAMVRTTPGTVRSYHGYGVSDPAGFGAMGIVETLVHTHDIAAGLGLAWTPPDDLCDRVLHRLFPDAPTDTDRWPSLLWATGRAELPGHPRRTSWRWDGTVQNR
jgi:hypothetical protein